MPSGVAFTPGSSHVPSLDQALEYGEEDPAWTKEVLQATSAALSADPTITVAAQCVESFCRLTLEKAASSKLDWPEIDQAMARVAPGETIFLTEQTDRGSVGRIYVSARDEHLPLHFEPNEEE